jgi:hypothetical protein
MKNILEKPAIPFQLQDVHGGLYKLDDFAKRWLLMVFHRHLG